MPDIGARSTRIGDRNIAYFQWLRRVAFRAGHGLLIFWQHASSRLPGLILSTILVQSSFDAYTLDNSLDTCKCTATKYAFPTAIGNRSVFAPRHDKGSARTSRASPQQSECSYAENPNGLPPSLSQPAAGFAPASGGPKQYRSIGGQTVIFRAMEPFCRHPQIFAVQPVVNPDDTADVQRRGQRACATQPPANGGATRQASVHAGLEALASQQARHRADPRRGAAVRVRRR